MDLEYHYNPEVRAAIALIRTRIEECRVLLTRRLKAQRLAPQQIKYQIINDTCIRHLQATHERILSFAIPIAIRIYPDEIEEKPTNE